MMLNDHTLCLSQPKRVVMGPKTSHVGLKTYHVTLDMPRSVNTKISSCTDAIVGVSVTVMVAEPAVRSVRPDCACGGGCDPILRLVVGVDTNNDDDDDDDATVVASFIARSTSSWLKVSLSMVWLRSCCCNGCSREVMFGTVYYRVYVNPSVFHGEWNLSARLLSQLWMLCAHSN